jgi:TRAP-type transport system periplasmic protein
MSHDLSRRAALGSAVALAAAPLLPAWAQAKPLRFAAVFSDKDIRADMIRMLAKDIERDFKLEPYLGATLFKQGTELVALQRDNLEMSNISPQDISRQVPEWSLLTSAYLFRDANHLNAFFASDLGAQMKKLAEDKARVKILGPTFFGTRQVGLRPKKRIATPADMAGIKLRMPPGDAWQLLGRSLGANPTPMAFAETYTGLQTGAIDGQDNPLPNVLNMKFHEVMSQIVLTSHLVGFDLLTINLKTWTAMSADQQRQFQAAVDKAIRWSTAEHLKRETELVETFKQQGLEVYVPDIDAFRAHAQKVYLAVARGEGLAEGNAREDQRVEVMRLRTASWLRRRAENVAAAMLAVMFVAFVVQIVFRYFLNLPVGWTSELTLVMWLWLVLWGSAFVVREREAIRFDLLTAAVGKRARVAWASSQRSHRRCCMPRRCRRPTTTSRS